MAPTIGWKKLKEIFSSRNVLKGLRSLDKNSLKVFRSKHGRNALHLAAKKATLAVNKYLVQEVEVEVNHQDIKNAYTPLIYALLRNDCETKKIARFLVNSGADESWTDIIIGSQSDKIFPANKHVAALLSSSLRRHARGYQAAADYLLDKGWTFENIAYLLNYKITGYALTRDRNLLSDYEKFMNAVIQQDVNQIKQLFKLVSHSKRITSWGLLEAARIRSPKSQMIIKLLLNNGVSVHGFPGEDINPLKLALAYNAENALILLDHGAMLDSQEYTMHENRNFSSLMINNVWQYYGFPGENTIPLKRVLTKSAMVRILDQEAIHNFPIIPSSLRAEDKESYLKNCIRLMIEHQGVRAHAYFLLNLSLEYHNLNHQAIEYISLVHHWRKDDKTVSRIKSRYESNYDGPFDAKYYKECNDELKRIAEYKFEERIGFWDLLLKSIDQMIPLTKNDSLMKEIRSESFVYMFPRYGELLQFKVNKAFEKRLLVERSIDVLSKCLPLVGSCLPVLEKIIYYMNDPYILNLE